MAKGFDSKQPKKVSKRQKEYFKLIGALLQCRSGQELKVLRAKQHLIDAGLLQTMVQVAMLLKEEGERERADFLMRIAASLAGTLKLEQPSGRHGNTGKASPAAISQECRNFIIQANMSMLRSDGSPESAHPILQAYLERDPHFIQRFRNWATDMQSEAEQKAFILYNFSQIITNFPLGNVAENIEETIACCQTALKVLNRDANSELWAEIQNLLGIAYGQRIKGDRAENLEVAIDAFEKALQVVTREDEDSPEGWGKIQNNLGNAYRDRIWGDKAENLERAIAAHQAALQVRTRDVCPKLWAMTQMNLAVDYRHRIEGDRAENLELALAANKAALEVYTLQEFPRDWAGVQMNLGNAYCFRIRGEKSENLDQASAAFQAALQVYTRNAFPEKWAMAQMHLGTVSQERGQIAEALTYYRAALEISTPTAYPEHCFKAGQNMGNTAFRAELWAEAIEGYTAALEAVEQNLIMADSEARRQEIKTEYQHIYANMVQACANNGQPDKAREYAQRSGSLRPENQRTKNNFDRLDEVLDLIAQVQLLWLISPREDETAVYRFLEANLDKLDDTFIRCLRLVGTYIKSQIEPEEFVEFYSGLLKRTDPSKTPPDLQPTKAMWVALELVTFIRIIWEFPKGNRATNIEIAIAGLEVILPLFTACPEEWASYQNNLAAAYKERIYGDRRSNIEKAIDCYRNALQVIPPESSPALWGDLQNNLAIVYSERLEGERAQNIEQAIALANQVLLVCTRDAFSEQWVHSQANLGKFYLERVSGNPAENLEISIRCYQDALQICTLEAFPQYWWMIQQNLGLSYSNRIKGDPAENIELAIGYFQAALQVVNREAFPVNWVTIQCNLGNAYSRRIVGDPAGNMESEIRCYEAAREVATLETMPEQWALVQFNLGFAYGKRRQGNQESNLKAAIDCYKAALQVWTRRAYPQRWATVQNNLGIIYGTLGMREQHIEHLQASLEVCTREAFPLDWAETQYNIGLAYIKLQRISQAIKCLRLSLEIFTPSASPVNCLTSASELGDVAFDSGRFAEAIEAYALAIEAVETSRTWVASESRRQEIMEKAIPVYHNMVQACINTGKFDKAFEYVERSRCKRLVDLMASNDLYSGGEIPPDVRELLQQFDSLQQQIDRQRFQKDAANDRELMGTLSRAALKARNDTIAALEAQKLQIWEQIRRLDPVLAGEIKVDAPNLLAIQQLISQPTTAILSFYTTESHTYIFVVRQNQIAAQICPGQGIKVLPAWIRENWLLPYLAGEGETKEQKADRQQQWRTGMSPFLAELAHRLEINKLIAEHLAGIEELIIVPHHLLHLIPFAALPVLPSPTSDAQLGASAKYLGDKFLIRYTPSCQILQFCANRGEVETQLSALEYGTVEDAEDNLPCAGFEGEQIAQLCGIPESRRLKGKTQATRDNYRRLAEQVQVLHSCHHAQSRLDNPLESVLRLGDGSITLGQLMTPAWRLPALSDVFLSCCETGLGVPPLTEDILTLSTGFLCAGARSAVSTLWAVNDLATALFSIFYYKHRQEGNSRPEALRQAQVKLRELTKADLAEISQQVSSARKEARSKRKQFPEGSEDYLKWDGEYRKYAGVTNQIDQIKNYSEELPFSQLCFWAAFTCAGSH